MESILVSDYAIATELRRAASAELLSNLTSSKLHELALKYFGIYENGELVGYQCPYSGKKITNPKKIVLEHIIPISRGGGTVLFNCIPTSVEVNKSNEKGTKHLISWWKHPDCKYWNKNAPARLEKIINYLLEGYEITINEENLENSFIESYSEDNYGNNIDNSDADLSTTQEDEQKKNKNKSIITYYVLMNDLINALSEYTDVSLYQEKLQNLIKGNVFEKIKRQTLIQKHLKDIIKNKLEIEDRSELTYTLNINISKLSKSLEKYSDDEIYSILEKRIDNLEYILNNNNLSLDSFFTDNNSLIYLYKDINDLTQEDIKELINNVNMNVNDKFKSMVDFVLKNNGVLPSTEAKDEKEKILGRFRNSIKHNRQNESKFFVYLTGQQLKYLHDSEFESLREIYKVILNKSIEKDIEIAYIDEQMKSRILEFREKNKLVTSLKEQIILENEYSDVLHINSQFNQFIDFVLKNNGVLPKVTAKGEKEKKLGVFRSSLQKIKTGRNKFHVSLISEQLKYLHDSEFESLREIYKVILNKSIEKDIEIAYIDEQMKSRILEFREKNKLVTSLKEQIILENEYSDVLHINSQFNQFIDFVLRNNGILPSTVSKDEKEKKLGAFRSSIQRIEKVRCNFATSLTSEQLKYLHDSGFAGLREIYKVILNKSIEKDIEIAYIDEQMKSRILEFREKNKLVTSLKEQIILENKYSDVLLINSQFNQFIDFVLKNNGVLPRMEAINENEKRLGNFRNNIQQIYKNGSKFVVNITKEQLEYLHNSEYESLRNIYDTIIKKAISINYETYIEINNELELERRKVA